MSGQACVAIYYGWSARLVLIGVEPGTLRFRVDVISEVKPEPLDDDTEEFLPS